MFHHVDGVILIVEAIAVTETDLEAELVATVAVQGTGTGAGTGALIVVPVAVSVAGAWREMTVAEHQKADAGADILKVVEVLKVVVAEATEEKGQRGVEEAERAERSERSEEETTTASERMTSRAVGADAALKKHAPIAEMRMLERTSSCHHESEGVGPGTSLSLAPKRMRPARSAPRVAAARKKRRHAAPPLQSEQAAERISTQRCRSQCLQLVRPSPMQKMRRKMLRRRSRNWLRRRAHILRRLPSLKSCRQTSRPRRRSCSDCVRKLRRRR